MKIILFAGKARHGKDASASIFKYYMESRGKACQIIGYGHGLKFACEKYFGWGGVKDSHGRTVLQKKGEEARENNPDTWVNIAIELIKAFWMKYDYVLIPDFRYPNEHYRLIEEQFNVFSVWIHRKNFKSELTEEQKQHHSETSLLDFPFNFVISVDSGVDNLKTAVENMIIQKGL